MIRKHTLWIEKYRSETLDNYIGNEIVKERMSFYIKENTIPHLLLSGTAGVGKTTLAKLLGKTMNCDYMYINASDENGIDTIREKIKGFASSAGFQPLKIVILDEADFLTQPAQAALRSIIEENTLHTRFILTCNYVEKLIEPITSRCEVYKLQPPTKGEVAKHLALNILDKENIKYEISDIKKLVQEYYPDIRSIIKYAQASSLSGTLNIKEVPNSWLNQLLNILVSKSKNIWIEVRQLVANEQVDDFQLAYRFMFDNLDKFANGNDAEISIILDDHMWRSSVVPDKEINFAAAIAKITPLINKKVI